MSFVSCFGEINMSKMLDALMATGHWGEVEVELGVEFNFRCAYCGKDLLSSVDHYKEWQKDHIVPASKEGADSLKNYALSCRTCNFIKSTWNPLDVCNTKSPTKSELIKLSQDYIKQKRIEILQDIEMYKDIIEKHS